MTRREARIVLYLMVFLAIPLTGIVGHTLYKALHVCRLDRKDYVFATVRLTKNACRKYGGGSAYTITYGQDQIEGRDGYVLFAEKGDAVKIYFNKKDPYDNGVLLRLVGLAVAQCLFLLFYYAALTSRLRRYYNRRPHASAIG